MTPYRKKILSCYCGMLTSQVVLFKSAFQMHMHLENEEMEQYFNDDYEFSLDMIAESEDPVVAKIDAFISETDNFVSEIEERNQLSAEDISEDDVNEIDDEEKGKQVRANKLIGYAIFYLRVNICLRIEKALRTLCEIKNEIPPVNFKEAWEYNDDNIQSIALFYNKLSALLDDLEKETDSIQEKRNW